MFQLSKEEFEALRFQIETLEKSHKPLRLQNETLKKGRGQHSKYFSFKIFFLKFQYTRSLLHMIQRRIIVIEEFKVIGISVRTLNKNGQSQKDIGNLWGKFMGESILNEIPNKLTHDVYCIYTDYEDDLNGQYTTIIGCKVNSFENIPDGFITWTIPTTKYQVFKSIGKLPEAVVMMWTEIWMSSIDRSYSADFDVYVQKAQNPKHAKVDTYVSIK